MKTVLITGNEDAVPADCLQTIRDAGIELACRKCEGEAAVLEFSKDADLIWMFGPNRGLTGAVLRQLPRCKAIFRSGSGLDALPCADAKELGIDVLNTPESIAESVAEHAVSLLFALIRQIPQYDVRVRKGFNWGETPGLNWHISGRTRGLVGYGRIARNVEAMVQGFRMRVIHYDPFLKDSLPLAEVLKQSDYVSLHCPLTDGTKHMIDDAAIGKMKKGVVIINTSRGALIDAEALLGGIKSRKVGAACLDVYEEEADIFFEDRSGHIMDDELLSRLISMPNVIVTSHQAFLTEDALNNIAETTVKNILSYYSNDGMCDNELCYRCGNVERCKRERKEKCF